MSSAWDPGPFSKDEVPFPWVADAPGGKRVLPESNNGYTVETKVSETTTSPGGPFVILAGEKAAVSFGMLDQNNWQATISQKNSQAPITKTISFANSLSKPVIVRVDVPSTSKLPVRFFLNNTLVFQSPLPEPISGPVALYLLRSSFKGFSNFYFVSVRSYQIELPNITFHPYEKSS